MKVAVIGVTGLVGQTLLRILEERKFPADTLIPVASQKSLNQIVPFKNQEYQVKSINEVQDQKPELVFLSSSNEISKEWGPKFIEDGATVIDNSSEWRMDPNIKLVVAEINGSALTQEDKLIANPNCSTMQMVLALAPLHEKLGIRRVVVSTYQSVTGTGAKAVLQLDNERTGVVDERAYPHQIDLNCIPHGGTFLSNGYTTEEEKLVDETRKILGDNSINITATVVRIPVLGGHSESVNVEFKNDFELDDIIQLLKDTPGITVEDDPASNKYPMPLNARGKDDVFVGRIRRDESQPNTLNMWIVSDNLRKGAATNAVQIAEYLLEKEWL